MLSKRKNFLLLLFSLLFYSELAMAKKCFYLASYHQGYQWADGVEEGLKKQLDGKCEFKQFNMDTKRHKDEAYKKAAGLKAKQLIEQWQPDVIIASDDNASEYVIKPFFKNHAIPVVFCGINWNVDAYGYPYTNATGMVEVAPIAALLKKVMLIKGASENAFYLGVDVVTERKNLKRFTEETSRLNIKLDSTLATSMHEWLYAYKKAQDYDFVIIGSNAGLNDWDKNTAIKVILKTTKKLSVTIQDWVMDYTIFGLTKVAQEQGDWAGQVALALLNGTKPSDIPIVANRQWDIWLNESILAKTNIKLPPKLFLKANKITD